MPDYSARQVQQQFVGKLGATEQEGRRHKTYTFRDGEGVTLGQTYLSHGHRDLDVSLIQRIARELGVRRADVRGAIDCTVTREAFYALMRDSRSS